MEEKLINSKVCAQGVAKNGVQRLEIGKFTPINLYTIMTYTLNNLDKRNDFSKNN